jgi:glucuronoarabinoxylan endo-1,4-beta-xylanase
MVKKIFIFIITVILCLACTWRPLPEPTASVNITSTQQFIRGFGGINYPGWRPDMTADQVNTAFGMGPGQIGMSILRIHVPYDSTKFADEVPTAQLAASLGASIFASPWTPPASLKITPPPPPPPATPPPATTGGYLNPASYGDYALHLKSFCDFMDANGATLYAISVQNEPDISVNYDSCDWTPTQMINFLKSFTSNYFGSTRIIVAESFNFNRSKTDPILNDPDAADRVSIIGGHIYGNGLYSYPLAVAKGKEIWMTEHYVDSATNGNDWTKSMNVAREIDACMNAGMSAYVWWYIVRYYGPIDESGVVTKTGYVMSQFSKFVRPGFFRVGATVVAMMDVRVTAYQNGNTVVAVIINGDSQSHTIDLTFQNATVVSLTPHVTSSTKNCEAGTVISPSGGKFSVPLDASSVTTVVGSY